MAYEISEGSAAAALLLSNTVLANLNNDNLMEYAKKIYDIVSDTSKIVMSPAERIAYKNWFDPDKINAAGLTAIVQGVSAAKGIKKWFKSSQDEPNDTVADGNVYLTGGSWHKDIKFLQVKVGKWDDYNSSDLLVIKGNCYYGISLKKKEKKSSANPPMINKSVVSLLKELGSGKIAEAFYKSRVDFFGKIVSEQINSPNGALKGSTKGLSNEKLFQMQVKHAYKAKEWVNLIDLKGEGALNLNKSGTLQHEWKTNTPTFVEGVNTKKLDEFQKDPKVRELFGYDQVRGAIKSAGQWKMRNNVNRKLGNINKLYDQISALANKNGLNNCITWL